MFVLDLATLDFKLGYAPQVLADETETFAGNFTAVDWTLNGATDAVYFGLAGGDALTPSGGVQRLSIDEAGDMALSALLPTQAGQAFTAAPAAHTDRLGQRWVQIGSGRLSWRLITKALPSRRFTPSKSLGWLRWHRFGG